MQLDRSTKNDPHSDTPNQSRSIDLQIRVLRRALARIQELQDEYSIPHTQSRVTPNLQRD